jgi:hypothetical protein
MFQVSKKYHNYLYYIIKDKTRYNNLTYDMNRIFLNKFSNHPFKVFALDYAKGISNFFYREIL